MIRGMRWRIGVLCLAVAMAAAACGGGVKRFMYEGFGRDDWQQPGRVIEALEVRPGARIADIGAGGGYFTFKLAAATGETGEVYAVDVDRDMVEHIAQRASSEGMPQVRATLAAPGDPGLPEGRIDLVFLANTYHHIEDRPAYFAQLRRALAPGGRVAIVEFRDEGLLHTLFGHATGGDEMRAEMARAGYRVERDFDFLERQHFTIFSPIDDERRDAAMRRADAAAAALSTELMQRLQTAMAAGGPPAAMRVCSEVAQEVTARVGGAGELSIRRTSLRIRNPANAPDEYERAWLEAAEHDLRAGAAPAPSYEIVAAADGGAALRHLRPILFPGGVCSQCHGGDQEIAAATRAILRDLYPDDRATGFRPGDLRGAISVRVPLR